MRDMGDDVGLYWSLFHDQFPGNHFLVHALPAYTIVIADDWRVEPGFVQYLSQLSAFSVEKLRECTDCASSVHARFQCLVL